MSSEINEQIKKIFVSPELSAKVADVLIEGKKPSGWSRRSTATYYGQQYAIQIKAVLDAMMADKQDRWYYYKEWPHMSHTSVYLRINQSLRYLLEVMDPDHRYSTFMSTVAITRERNVGVKLTVKEEYRDGALKTFIPVAIVPSLELPKWKQKIEKWLEESEPGDKPFILEGLMLTSEEVKNLKIEFLGLSNIISSITSSSIKLIKINRPV